MLQQLEREREIASYFGSDSDHQTLAAFKDKRIKWQQNWSAASLCLEFSQVDKQNKNKTNIKLQKEQVKALALALLW